MKSRPRPSHSNVVFDEPNEVSLPYNWHAMQVMEGGRIAAYLDFTKACVEPGVGALSR